jgi:hypothetical protein
VGATATEQISRHGVRLKLRPALITVPAPDFSKHGPAIWRHSRVGIHRLAYGINWRRTDVGHDRDRSRIDFSHTHSSVGSASGDQISAQINPGNSGPVMQTVKWLVAFQGYSGDVGARCGLHDSNAGDHSVLKDISNGHCDEYPDLAITYAKLQNPAQREDFSD